MPKVLVAFDGSDSAMRAVNYAAGMVVKDPSTEVTVMLVANNVNLDLFEASLDVKEKFIASMLDAGRFTLGKAKQVFSDINLPVKTILGEGDPSDTLNLYVQDNAIDIVIMGTRGLTSLKGMVLGSVSQKLIHLTDKPVLLIK